MTDFEAFWLIIGAIVIASLYFRHQTAVRRTQVIQTMVEKGAPIPSDLFQEPRRNPINGHTFIAAGILLLGLAAAALVFFLALTSAALNDHAQAPRFVPFLSAFPFFIGIACLVTGRYLKSHE
jgi:hypothetical protein